MRSFIFLIISILLISQTNFAVSKELTKSKMPREVIKSFEKEFPNSKKVHYTFENEGKKKIYLISFFKEDVIYKVFYNSNGSQIQFEEAIGPSELIDPVITYLMTKYMKFNIIEASKIYRNNIFSGYDIRLDTGKKPIELEFDKDGHLVKQH
jgi:hypothetical protein